MRAFFPHRKVATSTGTISVDCMIFPEFELFPGCFRPLGPSTLGPFLTVPTALVESGGPADAKVSTE